MSRIDLAFLGGRGFRSSYGGVENAIREIAIELSKVRSAHNVALRLAVCGAADSVNQQSDEIPSNVKLLNCPSWVYQKFGQHGLSLYGFLALVFVHRPRVVIVFASGPCLFVPLFRMFGINVVSSLRAIDSERDKWGWFSRILLTAGEYCAWRFANVFTVNSLEMLERYKSKRIDAVFLPNGARAANSGQTHVLKNLSLQPNQYFLFAARLDPVKRLHLLLKAHASIPVEQRLPLVVAGGHSKSAEYQQQLKQLGSEHVLFLGHIDQQTLDPLMRECRAFILPSVLEGMSNSLLSAMASGRAVLASDIKPNSDVLQHQDALFQADNIDDLQRGLMRLANDVGFAETLAKQLLTRVDNNHQWSQTAEHLLDLAQPFLASSGVKRKGVSI